MFYTNPKCTKVLVKAPMSSTNPTSMALKVSIIFPSLCNNALYIVIAEERESMGYGYYQLNDGDSVSALEYHQDDETKNESLHKYNDPLLDEFLAYLQKLYFDSQEETARSFSVSSVKI